MKRRRGSGKRGKKRRAIGPKVLKAPTARVLAHSPAQFDRLKRERDEALGQLAATSEVLRVISNSPGELEPVFRATLEQATRVCDVYFGTNVACFTRWHGLMCRLPFMISLSRKARLLPKPVSCLAAFASQKR